jgi:hypothetical protein
VKNIALIIGALLLGAVAIVAFSNSPKMHEAALGPVTETPTDALEPAPPASPALPTPAVRSGEETAAAAPAEPASAAEGETPADLPAAPPVHDPVQAQSCEEELKALGVVFEAEAPITGENGCGAERPLKVSSVGVELKPAVTTRCEVARALATWTKDVMIPSAKLHLNATPTAIATGDSYQCRARRGGDESKPSEHGRANAVDVAAIAFSDHETVPILDRAGSAENARTFQAAIRGGACAYFTTVLGPGTNAAHADHLHLDMIQRQSGYRICE